MSITNLRLAILICALGAMSESLFYTALAPLLTSMDAAFRLTPTESGFLVGGYAIGYWLGAYPAYRISARVGLRTTAVLGVGLVAVSTLLFAWGGDYAIIMGARILVGFGSVVAYTGVLGLAGAISGPEGRGAAIGTTYSGSAAGSAIGPLVGALAASAGRGAVFTGVAVGQTLVAILLSRLPTASAGGSLAVREILGHLRSRRVRIGVWVTSVPGFALGVLTVSGTHRLDELQAGSLVIAIAFSGIAVINVFLAPRIGRASDRIGRRKPLMLALGVAAFAVLLIVLASLEVSTVALIAIAGAFMLAIGGPGLALIGDGIAERGGDPTNATFLMNLFWGPAAAVGAIASGLVHGNVGAEVAFLMLSLVAAVSLVLVRRYA